MSSEQYVEYGKPAGFWLRVWAKLVDSLVLGGLIMACLCALPVLDIAGVSPLAVSLSLVLAAIIAWIAYLAYYTFHGRQTLGYGLAGIKVMSIDGSDIGFTRAVTRSALGAICYLLASYAPGIVIYLPIVFSRSKRGLHDYAAGTEVVRIGRPRKGLLAVLGVASYLVPVVLLFGVIQPFFLHAYYIPSSGMRPTLMMNDHILVNRLYYRVRDPRPGDIVVFKSPPSASFDGQERVFVQRLVALPGDVIEVKRGVGVFRNGELLKEPYVAEAITYDMKPVRVTRGMLFVMGDNRNNSNDGHAWGPLDRERLVGRAMFRFWPLNRIGSLE